MFRFSTHSLKILIGATLLPLCFANTTDAQELEFPISPTPIGAGARAAGMADAFVAIADDATAASWNPAGLVQLEKPEFSFVGSYNALSEEFFDDLAGSRSIITSSDQDIDNSDINFFSYTHPLPWLIAGRNSTVSVSYHQKYDLSRRYRDLTVLTIPEIDSVTTTTDVFAQQGQLSTVSFAYASELTHTLSIGVTANFWRDSPLADAGWNRERRISGEQVRRGTTIPFDNSTTEEFKSFKGENYIAGLLWNPKPKWSLAARYDSAFRGVIDFASTRRDNLTDTIAGVPVMERRKISFPDTLALGVAYRANDRNTVSMDVTRTDWNDMYMETASGQRVSMIDGQLLGGDFDVSFDSTITVRIGYEHLFIPEILGENMGSLWAFRAGLFYDEEAASGRENNLLVRPDGNGGFEPNAASGEPDSFYGASLGVGVQVKQRVNFDFAYQIRKGDKVNADYIQGRRGFSEDVIQHRLLISAVVYIN